MIVPVDAKQCLMSAPMIIALNADLKTQTRRGSGLEEIKRTARLVGYGKDHRGRFAADFDDPEGDGCYLVTCPYGGPGGQLWVRESIRHSPLLSGNGVPDGPQGVYAADGVVVPSVTRWGWKQKTLPGIHMPKPACRFLLDLTAVRVERLHSLTEADARAEGMQPDGAAWRWPTSLESWSCAVDAYREGWKWLNGEASWNLNPWVWVLSCTARTA